MYQRRGVYRRDTPSSLERRLASQAAARSALRDATLAARRAADAAASSSAAAVPAAYAGTFRRAGFYGRYGRQAVVLGNKPELKFFDTALSFNIDTTAEVPATGQLALIPQGDTESTRDGRLAYIKSIQIRANLDWAPSTAADASAGAYIWVILDTQCNGAVAAITDVFTGNNAGTALLNLNNSGRFRILKKIHIQMDPSAGVSAAYNVVHKNIECYLKCNIKMDWSSTTGAITEIRSNNIFLMAGAVGTAADDTIAVSGNARLRFQG